jgi:hypothetical protein
VLFGLAPAAMAATRLGLHVTQEELNVWKQRAGVVPPNSLTPNATVKYKAVGDVSTNSPGDWNTIVASKNAWDASPSSRTAQAWAGKSGSTCAQPTAQQNARLN